MKKCRTCGEKTMTTTYEDRALMSLPSVVVQNVKVRRCSACGEELVSFSRLEAMHEVIAKALVRRPGNLTGDEIRFLRKWLGWSGQDFAHKFALTPETVSRAENGKQQLSFRCDRLLRAAVVEKQPVENYSLFDEALRAEAEFQLRVSQHDGEWRAA